MRILLTIAYEGTRYSGWQFQISQPGPPTIQGEIENAIRILRGHDVRIHGAGRTDAGVHALGQRAHFDSPPVPAKWDWRRSLNAILPDDIRILSAKPVPDNFDANRQAIAKTYIYQFWTERAWIPPQLRAWVWACGPLNQERISSLLPGFLGEHDFESFRNQGTFLKSTIRHIFEITLAPAEPLDFLPSHAPLLRLTIKGSGFLKQMVRNIAGYLKAVSQHKSGLPSLGEIFEARNRIFLPAITAPAKGLIMARVHYGEEYGYLG